jgi:hypothetical protein
MRRHARQRVALGVVLAFGAVASVTLAAIDGDAGRGDGASAAAAKRKADLPIHGKVGGLYPGVEKKLRVHIRNTADRQMWVKAVETEIGDASPSCVTGYLYIKQKTGRHRRVPPHSHRRIKLRVRLASAAPDACQGAQWPLHYTVRVKRK